MASFSSGIGVVGTLLSRIALWFRSRLKRVRYRPERTYMRGNH